MHCDDVRKFLLENATSELSSDVEEHLRGCASCRAKARSVRQIGVLLQGTQVPRVQVDLPGLYRESARRDAVRARFYRRTAVAAGLIAAAAILLALVPRLEVRFEANQCVVRWGPSEPVVVPVPPSHEHDGRLRTLGALVQALADDAEQRDYRLSEQLRRVQNQLDDLARADLQRAATNEKDIAALYSAQFSVKKGSNP